jgi:hypothetical protein
MLKLGSTAIAKIHTTFTGYIAAPFFFLNPYAASRTSLVFQFLHLSFLLALFAFVFVPEGEAFFAVWGFAERAFAGFYGEDAWTIFGFTAGVIWVLLQKLEGLELLQFLESRGVEVVVDGEGLVEKGFAALLETAGLSEVACLGGDVTDWAVFAECMGAFGDREEFEVTCLADCAQ